MEILYLCTLKSRYEKRLDYNIIINTLKTSLLHDRKHDNQRGGT